MPNHTQNVSNAIAVGCVLFFLILYCYCLIPKISSETIHFETERSSFFIPVIDSLTNLHPRVCHGAPVDGHRKGARDFPSAPSENIFMIVWISCIQKDKFVIAKTEPSLPPSARQNRAVPLEWQNKESEALPKAFYAASARSFFANRSPSSILQRQKIK